MFHSELCYVTVHCHFYLFAGKSPVWLFACWV